MRRYKPNKKKFLGGKHDDAELVELAQFIRDAFPNVTVKRDWFIVFDQEDNYVRSQESQPIGERNYRHPDLIVFPKVYQKHVMVKVRPIVIHEVDGSVHDVHVVDTEKRNQQYENARLPLTVTNKRDITVSKFDDMYNKIEPYLKGDN
ncbi:hypothetical protein [Nitrosopumilus sp.]|uniref:hypothetical protein n=1 Tax=Nitrosopumilus sp. TaxID=2024843 RepID=UPI003D121C08